MLRGVLCAHLLWQAALLSMRSCFLQLYDKQPLTTWVQRLQSAAGCPAVLPRPSPLPRLLRCSLPW